MEEPMKIAMVLPAPRTRSAVAASAKPHVWRKLPDKPVVGLIDNSKARARDFLEALGREFVRTGFAGSYFFVTKPNASAPISETVRAELLARAHMIVSGIGD
jgi:hypothetical protein